MRAISHVLTFLWKLFFIIFMLICLVAYFLFLPLKVLLPKRLYLKLAHWAGRTWGKVTFLSTFSSISFEGRELLPGTDRICFIGNHQGFFDIPAFLGFLGRPAGFIAKKELFRIPILSHWMREIRCVFIDRDNARKAIESFRKSAEVIRDGNPIVIFPEGTRSRKDTLGVFHVGSLKLADMAEAVIVPFVIKGTWRIFEADSVIHPTLVKIRILAPILPDDPIRADKHALAAFLEGTIQKNLDEM